jgi:hypothetical protein
MVKLNNILDVVKIENAQPTNPLELVRLNGLDVAVMPFTSSTTLVDVYYCEEPGIRGYVRCNEETCILDRLGRRKDKRALLPVFLPSQKTVGVLPVSLSTHPGALLPQLMPFVEHPEKRMTLLIRKLDRMTFKVGSAEAPPTLQKYDPLLADFQRRLEAGEIDLASVYRIMDNKSLAQVDGIATLMKLKGVTLDSGN